MGDDVLAEEPSSARQHAQIARQVVSKIERKNQKRTLTQGGVNFHVKYSGTYLFLCVADADFPLRVCYKFLDDIEEVKGVMMDNIDKVLERQERLDRVVEKTTTLADQSSTFRQRSTALKRHFCMQHFKMIIIITVIVLVVLFFIIVAGCGGFSFPRCH
eukprot:EC798143.1.p2 GENE.EC798143.1~~EC798143.1.p2  ORF type:complete len:159 (+),score=76.49 EC798143.1:132-608(+)